MALTDNLIAVWCEAAAPTTDESGNGETLTDNGTVGTATGKVGTAGDFGTASTTKWLSHVDDAPLSTGDIDFTVAAWVYLSAKTKSYPAILAKVSSDAGTIEYQLLYRLSAAAFEWDFGGSGGSFQVRATTFGDPALSTWYHVVAWHAAGGAVGISVNAGTADTNTGGGGTDTNKGFAVGTLGEYHDSSSTWDGYLNQVAAWKRVLTGGERTSLYNGGAGLAFASWGGGGGSAVGADATHHRILLGGGY